MHDYELKIYPTLRHLSLVLFENLYSQKNSNKKQEHMKTSLKTKQIL